MHRHRPSQRFHTPSKSTLSADLLFQTNNLHFHTNNKSVCLVKTTRLRYPRQTSAIITYVSALKPVVVTLAVNLQISFHSQLQTPRSRETTQPVAGRRDFDRHFHFHVNQHINNFRPEFRSCIPCGHRRRSVGHPSRFSRQNDMLKNLSTDSS